jgi:hypothetical protein
MASTKAIFWNPTTPTSTAGGIVHGDGSKYSVTAAGTAGQVLISNGASDPTWSNAGIIRNMADGRLTTESGAPVSTADRSDQATIYYTPYVGNMIALYDGSTKWDALTFAETSFAVPATNGKPYDVFAYNNAGTMALETLIWTSATARATALVRQDGVLVKTGDTTRRYVGSFYPYANSKVMDTLRQRHLFNCDNRVTRPMKVLEGTANWTYTTTTWRQVNAAATNQLEVLAGLAEGTIEITALHTASNTSTTPVTVLTSIGADVTNAPSTSCNMFQGTAITITTPLFAGLFASLTHQPAVGFHFYAWLEISAASGTTTWYGNGGSMADGLIGMWSY